VEHITFAGGQYIAAGETGSFDGNLPSAKRQADANSVTGRKPEQGVPHADVEVPVQQACAAVTNTKIVVDCPRPNPGLGGEGQYEALVTLVEPGADPAPNYCPPWMAEIVIGGGGMNDRRERRQQKEYRPLIHDALLGFAT
jgi:hypothetical protein